MAGADDLLSMEFGGMAGEDDDVIVSLPGDTTQVIKDGDGVIVKIGDGGKKNEDPIDDLKGQFAAMTARATTAERIAQQASEHAQQTSQRLQQVEGQVVSSQLDTVLSGIAAAEAEASNAEKDFIAAAEAGDFPAQARAQRAMSAAEARKQRLSEAKDDLDDAIKTRPAPGPQQQHQRQPQQHTDPVERLIANGGIKGRSADWIRAHPIVATDPKANARMMAAHNLAVADDIPLDSDEYFQRIEAGVNKTAPVQQQQRQPASDGRRPSSAAAPASGGGGKLAGGTDVSLTRGEAASATDGTLVWNYDDPTGQKRFTKGQPIGLAEMARRKLEGKKAGLYDKSASE